MKKIVFILSCLLSVGALYAATPTIPGAPVAKRVSLADSVDLTDYVGKYKFESSGLPFTELNTTVQDGKLISTSDVQTVYSLTPLDDSPDRFDANGMAKVTFVRGDDKKVKSVTIEAMGTTFEGRKVN